MNHSIVRGEIGSVYSSIPVEVASRLLWLPDRARSMGIHIMAGKGSGKSRLMGRMIAWVDFLRGTPTVIFDPHGPTIDNFLDKLTRLPREIQEPMWRRVFYVDMSGKSGRVIPFPLYYRFVNEGLYEVSQRYLDVVRKLDPNLQSASVEGWNPLWRVGTAAGMMLTALGAQITEAEDMIRHPEAWERRFEEALQATPEVRPSLAFFEEFSTWKDELRARKSDSFLNKVALFTYDPLMTAMFGAGKVGIDWKKVVDGRYIVLLDFRREHDLERRRFKMVWAFNYLLSFIKHRGAGRHRPISLIVDELTSLFASSTIAADVFASELDELINVISRNYMVWLTLAHQEMFQVDERVNKTLMAMGTQMLGVTSDPEAALSLARHFFRYNPYAVKKYEPVYATDRGKSWVIDERSIEFTMDEQTMMNSYQFTDQGRFHFLVRTAGNEGDTRGSLRPVTLRNFDQDLYPDEKLVAQAREILMERRGRRVSDVLAEIDARRTSSSQIVNSISRSPQEIAPHPADGFDMIEKDGPPTDDDDDNPWYFGDKKTARNAQAGI